MKPLEHHFDHYVGVKSADRLGVLAQSIAACVSSAFQGGVTLEDALAHIQGDSIFVHRDPASRRVDAFSATIFGSPNKIFQRDDIENTHGAYFAAGTVRQEAQGQGLYKALSRARIQEVIHHRLPLIFTRTQNPRVQAGITSALQEFIDARQISSYSLQRIHVPGAYGQMLTPEKQLSDSVSFAELNTEAGDAFILLFALHYFTNGGEV